MKPLLPQDIKELKINNEVHANYVIDENILFLKPRKDVLSEDIMSEMIIQLERVRIKSTAYLNIK